MALVKLAKINEYSLWAAWKIEEPLATLMEQVPWPPSERTEWHAIHHPRKQAEWLAGRAALMAILEAMNLPIHRIEKDDKGKPFLKNSTYHISLANSYPYGVAILHRQHAIGIDIEQPSDKLLRIRHKFLNALEANTIGDHSARLCAHWCIKECLYKLYGRKQLSLKDNIRVHSVRFSENIQAEASIRVGGQETFYYLEGTIIDGFFVVYSVV